MRKINDNEAGHDEENTTLPDPPKWPPLKKNESRRGEQRRAVDYLKSCNKSVSRQADVEAHIGSILGKSGKGKTRRKNYC
jgi:hypothetical protein